MRIAVITGGMGGLGDSISTKMHTAGYRVVVTHSPGNTKAKEWISEHKASGREFSAYPADVAGRDGIDRNPFAGNLERQRLGESVHPGLRG
jgi:acetoacetyl-CoA reductase